MLAILCSWLAMTLIGAAATGAYDSVELPKGNPKRCDASVGGWPVVFTTSILTIMIIIICTTHFLDLLTALTRTVTYAV